MIKAILYISKYFSIIQAMYDQNITETESHLFLCTEVNMINYHTFFTCLNSLFNRVNPLILGIVIIELDPLYLYPNCEN